MCTHVSKCKNNKIEKKRNFVTMSIFIKNEHDLVPQVLRKTNMSNPKAEHGRKQ
jgi:hypothetical protein